MQYESVDIKGLEEEEIQECVRGRKEKIEQEERKVGPLSTQLIAPASHFFCTCTPRQGGHCYHFLPSETGKAQP